MERTNSINTVYELLILLEIWGCQRKMTFARGMNQALYQNAVAPRLCHSCSAWQLHYCHPVNPGSCVYFPLELQWCSCHLPLSWQRTFWLWNLLNLKIRRLKFRYLSNLIALMVYNVNQCRNEISSRAKLTYPYGVVQVKCPLSDYVRKYRCRSLWNFVFAVIQVVHLQYNQSVSICPSMELNFSESYDNKWSGECK